MDWSNLPPLNALRAFSAVAEHQSLTKAGNALNVTHAAVSQQIRNLEKHLGAQLVQRNGRGVALTPQGLELADTLQQSFADIAMSVETLSASNIIRPLQISMTPMFASGFLLPRLASFSAAHPDIELMLDPQIATVDLNPGGTDMAIRFGTGNWPGLEAELLMPGCLTVVAAKSLIGTQKLTNPAQLLDYPILQELASTEFADWLESRGVPAEAKRNVIHMPGNMLLDGLRRGDGICATVPIFIHDELKSGDLVILFEDPIPNIGYYIVTRPGVQRPPLRSFINWLVTITRAQLALI